jgi:hypothetical protein
MLIIITVSTMLGLVTYGYRSSSRSRRVKCEVDLVMVIVWTIDAALHDSIHVCLCVAIVMHVSFMVLARCR